MPASSAGALSGARSSSIPELGGAMSSLSLAIAEFRLFRILGGRLGGGGAAAAEGDGGGSGAEGGCFDSSFAARTF